MFVTLFVCSFVPSFVCSFTRFSFLLLFFCLFVGLFFAHSLFLCSLVGFVRLLVNSFDRLFVCSFVTLFLCSFCSLARLLVCLFRLFVRSFARLFMFMLLLHMYFIKRDSCNSLFFLSCRHPVCTKWHGRIDKGAKVPQRRSTWYINFNPIIILTRHTLLSR